jgi:acetylornithine/succinyldiaminopimelate/putrescine aminotransferase
MAPFSAVWATEDVCREDIAAPGLQSSTFSSCQTSIAIVSAVLDKVQQVGLDGLAERASLIGAHLQRWATYLARESDCVRQAAVHGCVLKLDLSVEASGLREHLLALPGDRLLIAATGLARHTALITPALIATPADIDGIGELLEAGLRQVSK